MNLTKAQEQVLDGQAGETPRKAMKLLVTLGEIHGARKMVKASSAHVSGVSHLTIGDAGLEFLRDWSGSGAVARVRATTNPAGMDRARWREMNVPETFAHKQLEIMRCFDRMKIESSFTCVPYLSGNRPRPGQHVSWAESSAVIFANSVLQARTNREGGPSALASALTGVLPCYGLHVESERKPTYDIHIDLICPDELYFSALGYTVGKRVGRGIPNLIGFPTATTDELKAMGASMATSGAIPMFVTNRRTGSRDSIKVGSNDLRATIDDLTHDNECDHVCLGCPHLSLNELQRVAALVAGKRLKRHLWCFTSSTIRQEAERQGYVQAIEGVKGKVFCDTCMVVAPLRDMGADHVLTNSCKAAHYLPSTSKAEPTLRNLEECIKHAIG